MSAELHIFTSAAVNYLPKVRTLCRSIKRHHPEAMVHLALGDVRPPWLTTKDEPFDSILEVGELGIENWRAWTFGHNIVELSTAIKPFVLKHLLGLPGCKAVLYFDPDMVLFSRVDDILGALETSNLALTPHQSKPETTLQAIIDNEIGSLKWGVFNLGFIGVRNTPEGHRFADWWAQRCYYFCRADLANGLFTDQKWLDFAPIFFEGVHIVKSPRHNVATWNLTTRSMVGDPSSGFVVDGEPMGFYHFTGFDSGAHRIMAVRNASGNASVQKLIAWYEEQTVPARDDPVNDWPWAFSAFSDGMKIAPHYRWLYRDNDDLREAFDDPYDVSRLDRSFRFWCETEGTLRFPQYFTKRDQPPVRSPIRARVPFAMAWRLLGLALSPTKGKALRARIYSVLRREGLGGIAPRPGNAGVDSDDRSHHPGL